MKEVGEVSAIIGYNKQYEICAIEIYESLLNNKLELVEFASNNYKKLDDVLIINKDTVLAYQVKDIGSNFTYLDFVSSDTISLLKGCFDDWRSLKNQFPDKQINACYVSNQNPSSHDRIKSFSQEKLPSFKDFKEEFWDKLKSEQLELTSISKGWKSVFDELVNLTQATEKEMIEFIQSFNFILGNEYKRVKETFESNNYQRISDVEKISKQIFSMIGRKGSVTLNRSEVLREFDLLSRYETHFKHSFFVDEEHYQPIGDTINEINELIYNCSSGYIALIGNAGSGKSTLLTKWIKSRNENVLKYYAYVNKEINNEYGYRGEAEIFLKDLLIQVRERQFSKQENLPSLNIQELQKQFYVELKKLELNDEKTFIIVDGLDHIEREQKVNRSLIDILPSPNQIPNNIYFILGTRTTENLEGLPDRIKLNLKDEKRVVNMRSFSFSQTKLLIESHGIFLSQNQIENLHENTLGHPLFLRYTIEELKDTKPINYDNIISQKDFKGDIYDEYRIFWNKNKNSDHFIDLLGIISRFRYSYIDLNLLAEFISDRTSWNQIQKVSEHYFYKRKNVWQYFHNSFKEFLKEETAKNFITDEYDEQRNNDYHHTIYKAILGINNEYHYNILYHLFESKDFQTIVETASQSYFREQYFNFRNYRYIFEDIKLAAKASCFVKNPKCLFQCFLANIEINQRIDIFTPDRHYKTFFQLNKIDIANSFIFNATEIFVSKEDVLTYALRLYKTGHIDLAYDLLKKGEPEFHLNISKEISPNHYDHHEMREIDEVLLIIKWAKLSSLFYPIEDIFKKIGSLKINNDKSYHGRSSDRNIFTETIEELTKLYIELEDWNKLRKLVDFVEKTPSEDQFYFYFDIVWTLKNDNDFYLNCLNKLKQWKSSKVNPINKRLALFHVFYLENIEKGKSFFDLLDSPIELAKSKNFNRLESHFLLYIFDYSRLFYITSRNFEKTTSSFTPKDNKDIVSAYYLEFAELGKSYSYIYINKKEASKDFNFRIKQIMNYFHFDVLDHEYEYSIQNNKPTLINLLLKISAKISKEFFIAILEKLEEEWENNSRYWKDDDKQRVIEYVLKTKNNNEWCLKHLESLDKVLFENDDIHSRIDKGIHQIKLWSSFHRYDKAENILKQIMVISVDVRYEKEYQLNYMIDWVKRIRNDSLPEITSYFKSLESIKYKTSRSSEYLAEQILRFSLKNNNGYEIFHYLLFRKFINFNDSLEIVLASLLKKFPENWRLFAKIFFRIILSCDGNYGVRDEFLNKLLSLSLHTEDLKLIIDEINIYSVSEYRNDYLFKVQKYLEVNDIKGRDIGISISEEFKEKPYNSSVLRVQDNKHFTFEEVLDRITSFDDFQSFFNQEDRSNNYFNWSKVVAEKIELLNDSEVNKIIEEKQFDTAGLVKIAANLFSKNRNSETIVSILNLAIRKSSKANWDRSYDGGSKIEAYNILNKLNKEQASSAEVFEDLAENIDISSNRFLEYIDEVFKLIDKDFNYEHYYKFLKEYKTQILTIHISDEETPKILGEISDFQLLKQTLIFISEIPSGFDDFLIEMLNEEFENNEFLIKELLDQFYSERFYFKFIKFLSILSINHPSFVLSYKRNIIEMYNNDRFDIHSISLRILARLNVEYKSLFIKKTTETPFLYKMEIPYQPEIIISEKQRMERLNKTNFLRNTNDPLEFCHLYLADLKEISRLSGFPIINIAHRIKYLGEKFYLEPEWYKGLSEKEIRDIYEYKFELKIPYNRPQYQKVWCGLMIVLKELWELKKIDIEIANFISNHFDEKVFLIQPIKKPEFVKPIIKNNKDYAPSTEEKWVYELSEDYLKEVLSFKTDNFFILGEFSILEGQGDGISSEIRQSFVEATHQDLDNYYYTFNLCTKRYINEYHSIDIDGICIYNWIHTTDHRRNWLAINPRLANAMNLRPSDNGSFRWLDENGNIVVESFYWKSNYEKNRSRNLRSESGQGWIVTINQEGLKRIKELGAEKLFHHRKIFRKMEFSQRKYKTQIKEENNLSSIEKMHFPIKE